MSWNSYIDNVVGHAAGNCDKVCIIGLADGNPWTTAEHASNITLAAGEGAKISAAFRSKDFTTFQAGGVFVEGEKYQFLREEDQKMVMAKKKDKGSITIGASKTALVIAHTKEGGQQGNTNKGVSTICEYLESSGM